MFRKTAPWAVFLWENKFKKSEKMDWNIPVHSVMIMNCLAVSVE